MTHCTHQLITQADPLCILQMTDTHLYTSTDGELLGVSTQKTFEDVLKQALSTQKADAIMFTGDIAQTASDEVYTRFKSYADATALPYFCLAGNHDDPKLLGKYFTGSDYHQVVDTPHWQFILLNSHYNQSPAGFLNAASLEWLTQVLTQNSKKPTAIFLHHHPVAMKSEWIDQHILLNADDFWASISAFSHIKTICFGHVHQAYAGEYNGIKLFASPATSVQFKPKSEDFSVENIASGFRWLHFFQDGSLETGVERLHYVPESLQIHSDGY